MKYLIIGLLVGQFLMFSPTLASESIYGFGDGKYYNAEGVLKYFCFLDKNCFNIDGVLVDMNEVLGTIPMPSYTQAVYNPYPETPTPVVNNPTPQPLNNPPVITIAPAPVIEIPIIQPVVKTCTNHLGGGRKINPDCY